MIVRRHRWQRPFHPLQVHSLLHLIDFQFFLQRNNAVVLILQIIGVQDEYIWQTMVLLLPDLTCPLHFPCFRFHVKFANCFTFLGNHHSNWAFTQNWNYNYRLVKGLVGVQLVSSEFECSQIKFKVSKFVLLGSSKIPLSR